MAKDTDYIAELKEINKQKDEIENKSRENIDNMESEYLLAVKLNKEQKELAKIDKRIADEEIAAKEKLARLAKTTEIIAKREALQKEVESAQDAKKRKSEDKWDEHRQSVKDGLTDPVSWMKNFLLQNTAKGIEWAISAKRRRIRREEKVAEDLKEQKSKDNLIEKEKQLAKLRSSGASAVQSSTPTGISAEILPDSTPTGISAAILPDSIPTGISAAILPDSIPTGISVDAVEDSMGIEELIDNSSATSEKTDSVIFRLTSIEALIKAATRQDNDQWKADQRISAGEEANASKLEKVGSTSGSEVIGGDESAKPKGFGIAAKLGIASGMKGILSSVIKKFGKAGKFLMSLGSRVLMPLLTTPIGWGILAALAVGGMVFYYWDDIKAFVGKMFDKIKTYFPKLLDGISKAFKTAVETVTNVLKFLNPLNLWSILLKAILPAKWYDSAAGWIKENLNYGDGSIKQQQEASDRKAAVTEEQQVALDKSVDEGFAATDEYSKKDRIKDLQAKVNANTATDIDKKTLKQLKTKDLGSSDAVRRKELIGVLEKEGIVDYNFMGESVILDRSKLEGMDRGVLQDMLKFNDWSDEDENIIKMNLKAATKRAKSSPVTVVPPLVLPSDNPTLSTVMEKVETQGAEIAADQAAAESAKSSSSTTNNVDASTNIATNNTNITKTNTHDNNQTNVALNPGNSYAFG